MNNENTVLFYNIVYLKKLDQSIKESNGLWFSVSPGVPGGSLIDEQFGHNMVTEPVILCITLATAGQRLLKVREEEVSTAWPLV